MTALSTSVILPGDTLWLRGGTYNGNFTSTLTGTQAAPIQVRQYPGERATLDNAITGHDSPNLEIYGAWTWYRDFEVTNSFATRVYSDPSETVRGTGINVYAPGTKIIHLVIHDTNTALGMWSSAPDSEAYGNVIFNAGIDAPDRGHGHGMYMQNATGHKLVENNISFNNFSHGIQVYGDAAILDNFTLKNNALFNNGDASVFGAKRNILVGGSNTANDPHLYHNYTYFNPGDGGDNNLGYTGGIYRGIVQGNTFARGDAAMTITGFANYKSIAGNIFIGNLVGLDVTLYPDNTYLSSVPADPNQVIITPDRYDPGRLHVLIYNWAGYDVIPIDFTGMIPSGSTYQIFDCQDYFGSPILTGTYGGGGFDVPVDLTTIAQPVGGPVTLVHTPREFNVFIVRFSPSPSDATPRALIFNEVNQVLAGASLFLGETVSGVVLTDHFLVQNIGQAALDLSTLTVPTAFSLSSSLTATHLIYGGAGLFTIQYDAPAPALNSSGTVSLISNATGSPFNFLISATTVPANVFIIDDSDTGYTTVGTWTSFVPQGFRSNLHYAVAGAGAAISTWDFTGLTPGTYRVSTTWVAFTNRATNAPFTILDGTTVIGSVAVNQQLDPSGFTDLDTVWQDLGGPYSIGGSELQVKLTNNANGVVIADAIRIELVSIYSQFTFGGHRWADASWAGNLATPSVTVAPLLGLPFDSYLIMRRRRPLVTAPPVLIPPLLGLPFDSYLIMRRRRPLVVAPPATDEESSILLCL